MHSNDDPGKKPKPKSTKINNLKKMLRSNFNSMEIVGGTIEGGSLLLAIPTDGATIPLAVVGGGISFIGTGGSTTTTSYHANANCTGGSFVTNTTTYSGISGALGANNVVGTLVFGTIMGGAGSSLTGGNFWQGAVTGLVVSGLNHAMHKMAQHADITERLKNAGYNDPQAAADYAGLSLDEFAQKVFPDIMATAKNPHFKKVETIDKAGSLGLTPVGANDVTGVHTFRGPILIAKASFSSYMQLASTMGHELSHVIDCVSGSMTTWFKRGGESYRSAMTELRAYQWVGLNGGNFNAPMYLYNLNKVGGYYNK